jgi:uncharacterized BrkB/YihY/UPF0761 family membrane protein
MLSPGALLDRADAWQRRHHRVAVAYGVVKKFSDDNANLLVVGLGWYGFTAIYPLLLVVVAVFGFVGVSSLGSGIVHTLHQFPVIGQQFVVSKGSHELHGSVLGLVVGVVGLLYGAQGVTQVAEEAMESVWNIPQSDRPGWLPRLGRSVGGLAVIGGAFVLNAPLAAIATASGEPGALRVGVIAGLLVLNVLLYAAAFRVLTPTSIPGRDLLPGALLGGVSFTLLITVGTGLIEHELKDDSATYGAFASVIGTVAFLLILAKLTLYAAELNAVLSRRLAPRALRGEPTPADEKVWELLRAEQRRKKPAAGEAAPEPAGRSGPPSGSGAR